MYSDRRKRLLAMLHKKYPEVQKGVVILLADLEDHTSEFLQESSFYYLTGITEPAVIFCMYWDGTEELFVPDYGKQRGQWVSQNLHIDSSISIKSLGKPCKSYWLKPFFDTEHYENIINELNKKVASDGHLFVLLDASNDSYFFSMYRFEKLFSYLRIHSEQVVDIAPMLVHMRQKKDEHELLLMKKAAQITCEAHDVVAAIAKPGMFEYEIQAEIESVFTKHMAKIAFPSIVATGKNTTILHYLDRNHKLKKEDLLIVDIGARVDHYCADITRTYSVSGRGTERQGEIYQLVLATQQYITSLAKPGMFLQNPDEPEYSLHHLACAFLEREGYSRYFVHGIGHFLGLEVHDVGNDLVPLEVGSVITIEPGVYIPEENIGVRIEDDFVITADGCRCLSPRSSLPKKMLDRE